MDSNTDKIKALVNSLATEHTTQVSLTRTRSTLLDIKKLCDVIRKEHLLSGKMKKAERQVKFITPEPDDEAEDIAQSLIDLSIDILAEPIDEPKPPAKKKRVTKKKIVPE
jgi:hypothetical protein